jgi:murein L,D-transpeptidase YcbB/YkuD
MRLARPLSVVVLSVATMAGFPTTTIPATAQDAEQIREVIRRQVEQIRSGSGLTIHGSPVASEIVLPELYERRGFTPAWTDEGAIQDMFRSIDDSALDGLDPDDYHRLALLELRQRFRQGSGDPEDIADFDMLMTDALVRLGYHILFGKVDPERLDPNWNMAGELGNLEPVSLIQGAIDSGRLYEVVDAYKPDDPFYVNLKEVLATYRAYAMKGGWEPVPDIARLELDSVDARVPDLRRRLAVTGDLPESAPLASEEFDEDLEQAVRSFQRRHGLADDGVVGRNTVAEMNVSVEERIDQLRVNLERGRWILRDLSDDFVAVNIAGFEVYVVEDREPVWTSRVVVGTEYHKSPIFTANMTYLVFNPTWTVPPGIIRNETLPRLKEDPGYLAEHHMKLLDRDGSVVDPHTVDFSQYSGGNFPYIVRQDPGPWNALGEVKFIFPNEHFVFLHDTPSRSLFDREVRAFSHGCIRVENPLELAEVLLRHQEGWDREQIDRTLASDQIKTVYLDTPLPVLLLYWTAWVSPEGRLTFYPDVYERDGAVLAGLEQDFQFRDRVVLEGPQ